jgi:phage gp16-like protein
MEAITASQIKIIHVLKSALAMDDGTYRAMLFKSFRVESSKQLTCLQAQELLIDLENKAISAGVWKKMHDQKKKYDEMKDRMGGMATPSQLRLVESLWGEVSYSADQASRDKALRSFLEKFAKISHLRFLDSVQASKVIEALKSMKRRKVAKCSEQRLNAL